jgi:hypothetical protein
MQAKPFKSGNSFAAPASRRQFCSAGFQPARLVEQKGPAGKDGALTNRNFFEAKPIKIVMKKYLVLLLLSQCLTGCAITNKVAGLSQAKELRKTGTPAQAKILKIADTGWTVNDDPVISFILEIYPVEAAPYNAQTKIVISRIHVPQFQPGAIVPVRIDPQNAARVSLDIYEF